MKIKYIDGNPTFIPNTPNELESLFAAYEKSKDASAQRELREKWAQKGRKKESAAVFPAKRKKRNFRLCPYPGCGRLTKGTMLHNNWHIKRGDTMDVPMQPVNI